MYCIDYFTILKYRWLIYWYEAIQSNPDLPCPDLPGTPIYRGHILSPYKAHLQVFAVQHNPDLPGFLIYRGNFLSPNNPGKSGFDCNKFVRFTNYCTYSIKHGYLLVQLMFFRQSNKIASMQTWMIHIWCTSNYMTIKHNKHNSFAPRWDKALM